MVSHHRPGFYMRVITEGRIQAGDQILKTHAGPHTLSVADADALLYLPHRDPAKLHHALEIPALSPGWQQSFRDLLTTEGDGTAAAPPLGVEPGPAWAGFRELQVDQVIPESATVSSIYLAAADGTPALGSPRRYAATRSPPHPMPAPTGSASSARRTAPPAAT